MATMWSQRVSNANKVYEGWENKFRCKTLENYYEGFQWKGKRDMLTVNYSPYTINLFYSTIKIKLANMVFQRPSFQLTARPGNSQWDQDFAAQSANLKQDVLNTIIQNPNANFAKIIKRAALDSFFRFGMVEVGYAADWRNPQKEPPYLKSHDNQDVTVDKVIRDEEVPVNERFYFKRINPRRFRVAVGEAQDLNDVEWCGYFDYYYTTYLRKTKGIKFTGDSSEGTYITNDLTGGYLATSDTQGDELHQLLTAGTITKVWHIWDQVTKERLLLEDGTFEELFSTKYERLPLRDLRWDERLSGWYPCPPTFQWLSSQDEINEAREQTRSFRRRFTRKFQSVDGMVEEEEVEKFASGPDGVVIKVKQQDAITPIQNPEQGVTAENALIVAKDDFNVISGTSAEARGAADRETATAAKITSARSQVRESADQLDFANFVCEIGRETLAQASEHLVEGMWMKDTANAGEQILTEVQVNQPIFKWITSNHIDDGYDFDVDLDVLNATPAAMEQAQQSFVQFLTLVQQFPPIAMSPVLIREAAARCGYRNEKVIHQMQQAAMLSMAAKAAQQAASQGQTLGQQMSGMNPNNAAQTQIAQMTPNSPEQVSQQLQQQVGQ